MKQLQIILDHFHIFALNNCRYIGDGVYAGRDASGQFWLVTKRDRGWHAIALDDCMCADMYQTYQDVMEGGDMVHQPDG